MFGLHRLIGSPTRTDTCRAGFPSTGSGFDLQAAHRSDQREQISKHQDRFPPTAVENRVIVLVLGGE
jgi:hypothetical protein